jgi:hypothetical protein
MYKKEQHISNDGEILNTKVTPYKDRFDDEKGYFLYSNGQSINGKAGVFFPGGLSKLDIGNLAILSRYLVGNTNMLGYRGNKSVKAMNVEQIAKVIGVNKRQGYNFLNKMMKHAMIGKVTIETGSSIDVQYYVNPIYFMNGRNLNLNLYLLFREQIEEHIPGWAQQRFEELREVKKLEDGKE